MTRIALFACGPVGRDIAEAMRATGYAPVALVVDGDPSEAMNQRIVQAAGLEVDHCFGHRRGEESRTVAWLEPRAIDLLMLAWWPHLIGDSLIQLPNLGCLNTHPSYLPHARGKDPNFWSIVEGRPFGVSLHWVDAGIDSGPIAFQKPLPVAWTDTGQSLYERACAAMVDLVVESLPRIGRGEIPRLEQTPALGSFHRRCELEPASEIQLDRPTTARAVLDLIRARTFPPHPGAWFVEDGRRYEVRIQISEAPT